MQESGTDDCDKRAERVELRCGVPERRDSSSKVNAKRDC